MQNNKIVLKKISFQEPKFRKMEKIDIPISSRITLIAGHNGVGKSTILAFISSVFGLTDKKITNYFSEPFYKSIEQILYIALDEADYIQENLSAAPLVTIDINDKKLVKRCAFTRRKVHKRARVVPRTVDQEDQSLEHIVGPDAKVPLPVIFLGMKRFVTAGEADENDVISDSFDIEEEDQSLIIDFMQSVILGIELENHTTKHTIKSARKISLHPGYSEHESLAISVGQDSLGNIATALASFNKLKREMGDDYPGGLLIIDELDVGFHPHALNKLAQKLKILAKELQLQIIATTHSPALIEAVHPEKNPGRKNPDKVLYLLDTRRPRLEPDITLDEILAQMRLEPLPTNAINPKKNICVYFEDEQAMQFFEVVCSPQKRGAITRGLNFRIQLIPLGVGGDQLIKLPDRDPIFHDRILMPDGDTTVPTRLKHNKNIVTLPCPPQASGTGRSPENLIRSFLMNLCSSDNPRHTHALARLKIRTVTTDIVLEEFFDGRLPNPPTPLEREKSKAWWKKHYSSIKSWGVIESWIAMNKELCDSFLNEFEEAVKLLAEKT